MAKKNGLSTKLKVNILHSLIIILSTLLLTACAGVLPVPGGSDTTNKSFYISKGDMKERIEKLKIGMSKDKVFSTLGRNKEELVLLNREQLVTALFGGDKPASNNWNGSGIINDRYFIQSLSGYRLNYKIIKRKHGIKNPITVQTDQVGFDYSAILIFQNDYLYEKPIISGGVIDNSSSKTLFDFITPGMVMRGTGL